MDRTFQCHLGYVNGNDLFFDHSRTRPDAWKWWLVMWRLVQGFGGAMLFANSRAIIEDAFPAQQRGPAMGINQVTAIVYGIQPYGDHTMGWTAPKVLSGLIGRSDVPYPHCPDRTTGPLAGYLSDRHGARILSTSGLLVFGGSFVGLLFVPTDFHYWIFGALVLLNGIGGGLFSAPNSTAIMNSVPPDQRGGAAGIQRRS